MREYAAALDAALQMTIASTKAAWATGDPGEALANAVPYMQALGHMVIAWVWLDVNLSVPPAGSDSDDEGRRFLPL